MRIIPILAALGALLGAFGWYYEGFQALPTLIVKWIVAVSMVSVVLDGIAASLGYRYKQVLVKIKE